MGKFLTPLIIEDTGEINKYGRVIFRLDKPLVYEIGENGTNLKITVPENYHFDYASVPKFFWRIIPPTGRYGKASCLHDFCCECKNIPRELADVLFLISMKSLKVKRWRRILMYLGIRFYWICWGKFFNNPAKLPFELRCK